jgi:hypothetical protein
MVQAPPGDDVPDDQHPLPVPAQRQVAEEAADAPHGLAPASCTGGADGVIRLPSSPGTLAVFRGQHALHRVTPVSGTRPRINSVLTYGEHPGMKLNELTQKLFYGRTA